MPDPLELTTQSSPDDSPAMKQATTDYATPPAPDFESYAKSMGAPVEDIKSKVQKEVQPPDENQAMASALASHNIDINQIPKEAAPTTPDQAGAQAQNMVTDATKGVGYGLADVAQNVMNAGNGIAKNVVQMGIDHGILPQDMINDYKDIDWSSKLGKPDDSLTVRAARSITQYAAPAVATMVTGGGAAAAMGIGAAANFLALDPHQQRFSTMLRNEVPEVQNYPLAYKALGYLANKPDEGEFEGRFKNSLEALGLEAPIVGTLQLLSKAGAGIRSLLNVTKGLQATGEAAAPLGEEAVAAAEAKMGSNVVPDHPIYQTEPMVETPQGPRLNFQNQQTTDTVAAHIAENPGQLLLRDGTRTWENISQDAKAIADSPEQMKTILTRESGDRPLTDAETQALRYHMGSWMDSFADGADAVSANPTPENLAKFGIDHSNTQWLLNADKGSGSDVSSALNARKLNNPFNAGPNFMDMSLPDFQKALGDHGRSQMIQDVLDAHGGEGNLKDLADSISAINKLPNSDVIAKFADPNSTYAAARGFDGAADAAKTIALNGMISSTATAYKVGVVGGVTSAAENASNYLASGIGTIRKAMNLVPEGMSPMTLAQANAHVMGSINATGEAMASAGAALSGKPAVFNSIAGEVGPSVDAGVVVPKPASNYEDFMQTGASMIMDKIFGTTGEAPSFVDAAKGLVTLPSRVHGAENAFFGTATYRGSILRQATAQAEKEGLEGPALAARAQSIAENPTVQMHQAASQLAQTNTFWKSINPDFLGGVPAGIQNTMQKFPLGNVLLPFFKVSTNGAEYVAKSSPLGVFFPTIRNQIIQGGVEGDMAMGKMALGSLMMATATGLTAKGMYTGPDTDNPHMKQALTDSNPSGWAPDSFKVGENTYIPTAALGPFQQFLRVGAVLAHASGSLPDKDYQDTVHAVASAVANFLTPEQMVQNTDGLLKAYEAASSYTDANGNEAGGHGHPVAAAMAEVASRFVPYSAALKDVAGVQKDEQKVSSFGNGNPSFSAFENALTDHLAATIPWMNKDLPPQRNIIGDPLMLPHGMAPGMVSAYAATKDGGSEVLNQLQKLAAFGQDQGTMQPGMKPLQITMPSKTLTWQGENIKMPLNDKQYDALVMYSAGKMPDGSRMGNLPTLEEALQKNMDVMKGVTNRMSADQYNVLAGSFSKILNSYRTLGATMLKESDPDVRDFHMKASQAMQQQKTINTFQ